MSDRHDEIYKQARDAYGLEFEVGMLQEECAEIIVACSKLLRFPEKENVKKMFEEIADAENLFEQMKRWFPDMREYVDEVRAHKLDRLGERIKEGKR
jgi:hypothetical protein